MRASPSTSPAKRRTPANSSEVIPVTRSGDNSIGVSRYRSFRFVHSVVSLLGFAASRHKAHLAHLTIAQTTGMAMIASPTTSSHEEPAYGLIEHCRMIRVAHNRDSIGFRSVRAARHRPFLPIACKQVRIDWRENNARRGKDDPKQSQQHDAQRKPSWRVRWKTMSRAVGMEIREHKSSFAVYVVLRMLARHGNTPVL